MDDLRVVGVARLTLKQRRFGDGALYVSAILKGGELAAIDCRFFVEKEKVITPTPKGFRIDLKDVGALRELFQRTPENVGEITLWSSGMRSLSARRCDDDYGKGIDIRYFKISADYKGWEKRGIRLLDEDFVSLSDQIMASGLLECDLRPSGDLFEGKQFAERSHRGRRDAGQKDGSRTNTAQAQSLPSWTPISAALEEFLSER